MRSTGSSPSLGQMGHLAEQSLDQAVEELVPAADVPVDGRDRDAQLLGEPAHGEGLHAVDFDQPGRGLEDDSAVTAAGFGRSCYVAASTGSPPVIRSDSGRSRYRSRLRCMLITRRSSLDNVRCVNPGWCKPR